MQAILSVAGVLTTTDTVYWKVLLVETGRTCERKLRNDSPVGLPGTDSYP